MKHGLCQKERLVCQLYKTISYMHILFVSIRVPRLMLSSRVSLAHAGRVTRVPRLSHICLSATTSKER